MTIHSQNKKFIGLRKLIFGKSNTALLNLNVRRQHPPAAKKRGDPLQRGIKGALLMQVSSSEAFNFVLAWITIFSKFVDTNTGESNGEDEGSLIS
jgi:hypothetical protein